ncbi:MAG: GNAT family N-acetyltransferase [Armatimonadetes bacterium]|nr:GNAT family N-acetyltransferase [Armatimonadota bacterium]
MLGRRVPVEIASVRTPDGRLIRTLRVSMDDALGRTLPDVRREVETLEGFYEGFVERCRSMAVAIERQAAQRRSNRADPRLYQTLGALIDAVLTDNEHSMFFITGLAAWLRRDLGLSASAWRKLLQAGRAYRRKPGGPGARHGRRDTPPDPKHIRFRSLRRPDLLLMYRWLNTPVVARWWRPAPRALEEVTATYLPCIEGKRPVDEAKRPVDCYIILHGQTPIGYIQPYRVKDHADFWAAFGVDQDAAGVDLFIGEPEYLHRGLGRHILTRFVRDVLFAAADVSCCLIDPDPENRIAIRAFEKAGFRYVKTFESKEYGLHYLMRLDRSDLPPRSA